MQHVGTPSTEPDVPTTNLASQVLKLWIVKEESVLRWVDVP